jgi:hypothetical protein
MWLTKLTKILQWMLIWGFIAIGLFAAIHNGCSEHHWTAPGQSQIRGSPGAGW